MKSALCKLKSKTPLTFGKYHQTDKLNKELPDAYEMRTWKEKAHYTENETVKIPGTMFANSIRDSAKFMSIPVPGKGKSTFTKHFDAGITIPSNIDTGIKKESLSGVSVHVPSDGKPGGSRRVMKVFPIVREWEGEIVVYIGDDIITQDVFEDVLKNAGLLIGIGTWRPRNRGMNGQFEVVDIKWNE